PLGVCTGQVVRWRGWRQAVTNGGSWWAQLARLTIGQRAGTRHAALTDLQVAAVAAADRPRLRC
ncbi:hypothetical protein, partial [Planobispora siamensis]